MSTTAKLLSVALLVVVFIAAIALTYVLLVNSDGINRAACDQIRAGMTQTDVEDLLGRKPDQIVMVGGIELQRLWIGSHGTISVSFDEQRVVVSRAYTSTVRG